MKATLATLVLAATAALASSSPNRHSRFHQRKAIAARNEDVATAALWNTFNNALAIPFAAEGSETIKPDGSLDYVNQITNNANEDLIFVAWPTGTFKMTDASPPLLTMYIPNGAQATVSMSKSFSGAMSVLGAGTPFSPAGQISNTWLEATGGSSATIDVSREVNTTGHAFTLSQSKCTTSMTQCVFTCTQEGVDSCWQDYQLSNCSQEGANVGSGNPPTDGGCFMENQMSLEIGPIGS